MLLFRGLASVHVMLYHYFYHSNNLVYLLPGKDGESQLYSYVNLQGGLEMPLFFLLSGFSLALGYGSKQWSSKLPCQRRQGEDIQFTYGSYFRNRFARIAPIYYLSQLMFIPAFMFTQHPAFHHGQETLYSTVLFTVTCTNTWFYPFSNLPFVLSSWTINTFFFFYLIFPIVLPKIQKFTDTQMARGLVLFFWLQLIPFTILSIFTPHYSWAYTINPVSRLPVFLMGVIAGLQNIRHTEDQVEFIDPNLHRLWIHNILPWGVMGGNKTFKRLDVEQEKEDAVKVWSKRVDQGSGLILVYTVGVMVTGVILGKYFQEEINIVSFIDWNPLGNLGQLLLVHQYLMVIVGLTRDQGTSYLSWLCTTRLCQFFGLISMTLYLIHQDMPLYLLWPLHPHAQFDPQERQCSFIFIGTGPQIGKRVFCLYFFT